MSKGDKRREKKVDDETYEANWERIFGIFGMDKEEWDDDYEPPGNVPSER